MTDKRTHKTRRDTRGPERKVVSSNNLPDERCCAIIASRLREIVRKISPSDDGILEDENPNGLANPRGILSAIGTLAILLEGERMKYAELNRAYEAARATVGVQGRGYERRYEEMRTQMEGALQRVSDLMAENTRLRKKAGYR
jgi:hypothetical protein